jgi:hypothetical protein
MVGAAERAIVRRRHRSTPHPLGTNRRAFAPRTLEPLGRVVLSLAVVRRHFAPHAQPVAAGH